MANLTQELLQKYVDGELPVHRAEKLKAKLDASPEDKLAVQEWTRIGDLLRVMDKETTADVSFEGLSEKVLAEIKTTRTSLSVTEKLKTWFSEFFEHRRAVWIPATAAIGAACLAVVVSPLFAPAPNVQVEGQTQGIVLHSTVSVTAPIRGSRIAAVDFGGQAGAQYIVDDGTGTTVGVVWILE